MTEQSSRGSRRDLSPLPNRPVEHVLSANAPVIYANNVEVRTSLFDTTIQLGLVEEATAAKLVVRELGRVILSPPHAKALAKILSDNVDEYERVFGPIPTGPEDESGGAEATEAGSL